MPSLDIMNQLCIDSEIAYFLFMGVKSIVCNGWPCTSSTTVKYIEHPDYPGVYINPKPIKKPCNITEELLSLNYKILLVQHPIKRLINAFKCENETNFIDFVKKLVTLKNEKDLNDYKCKDMILHQWNHCAVCQDEVRPNFIIKLEHFQAKMHWIRSSSKQKKANIIF